MEPSYVSFDINYFALFLTIMAAVVLAMPLGKVLGMYAEAAVLYMLDKQAEKKAPEPEVEEVVEIPEPKRSAGPRTRRLDPEAERIARPFA